jgi:glyoxylase-like metal-dependent hydrolase (beta-lactamase superfamily II)
MAVEKAIDLIGTGPTTAIAHRRDTYADHGLPPPDEAAVAYGLRNWLPYLHPVVEATTRLRGGEHPSIGGRVWQVVHRPGHSVGHVRLYSPISACSRPATSCCPA